jgi:hypothetical protein
MPSRDCRRSRAGPRRAARCGRPSRAGAHAALASRRARGSADPAAAVAPVTLVAGGVAPPLAQRLSVPRAPRVGFGVRRRPVVFFYAKPAPPSVDGSVNVTALGAGDAPHLRERGLRASLASLQRNGRYTTACFRRTKRPGSAAPIEHWLEPTVPLMFEGEELLT